MYMSKFGEKLSISEMNTKESEDLIWSLNITPSTDAII